MSFTVRTRLGAVVFGLLVAGCPTGDPGTDDGGGTTDGGTLADGQAPDSATKDSGPPPPACGRLTTVCAEGGKCDGPPDCASKICRNNVCQAAAPADGTKNGDETDVDCGGSKAPACVPGKGCLVAADCSSSVCKAGVCAAPSPTDGVKNGDETGKDCGGAVAPKCAAGEGCLKAEDCDKVKCDIIQKKCLPAAHNDGIKNLDETGIDCGGPTASVARCAPGQGCAAFTDCANVACNAATLVCDPPSSSDNFKNGTETDVDCGGGAPTSATACALGKACLLVGDCLSTSCNYAKKCVEGPSCNGHFGGDTCGAGEVGQAGAAHESCCARLPLPGNAAVSLGKYEITAGRVREFVTKTGGNVRQWVDNNRGKTAQIADGVLNYLPEGDKLPIRTYAKCEPDAANNWTCGNSTRDFGIYTHLGSTTIFPDRPCRTCGQGCWFNTGAGENGHTTYWFDKATQVSEWGSHEKAALQSELDVKSLNCVTQVLLAAFCAWDGGRLPTRTELGTTAGAWGAGSFPWGNTPSYTDTLPGAAGRQAYVFAAGSFLVPMYDADGTYHPEAATMNSTNWNPFPSSPAVFQARYVWPLPLVTARNPQGSGTNDQAYAVAAPGRMRNDFRQVPGGGANDGFFDVAGNLIEVTGSVTSSDNDGFHKDFNGNPLPGVSWVGGSFEGHGANNKDGGYDLDILTKYGKAGGRCAYDN